MLETNLEIDLRPELEQTALQDRLRPLPGWTERVVQCENGAGVEHVEEIHHALNPAPTCLDGLAEAEVKLIESRAVHRSWRDERYRRRAVADSGGAARRQVSTERRRNLCVRRGVACRDLWTRNALERGACLKASPG